VRQHPLAEQTLSWWDALSGAWQPVAAWAERAR